jgi:hypothetical protein
VSKDQVEQLLAKNKISNYQYSIKIIDQFILPFLHNEKVKNDFQATFILVMFDVYKDQATLAFTNNKENSLVNLLAKKVMLEAISTISTQFKLQVDGVETDEQLIDYVSKQPTPYQFTIDMVEKAKRHLTHLTLVGWVS